LCATEPSVRPPLAIMNEYVSSGVMQYIGA
jgi:hypothetical protein